MVEPALRPASRAVPRSGVGFSRREKDLPSLRDSLYFHNAHPPLKRWAINFRLAKRDSGYVLPAALAESAAILFSRTKGTASQAAEKVEKQIPRRPEGLLVMTKAKGL